MNEKHFREFLFFCSWGEHLGDHDRFNNTFFAGYLSPDNSTQVISPNFNETPNDLIEKLQADSRIDSCAFHFNPQRVKARSLTRKNSDVEAIRAIIADIDRPITEDQKNRIIEKTKPTTVVQSSPGKYHFYWTVKPGTILPSEYARTSLAVSSALGADESLKAPAHTLRTPGFARVLESGASWEPRLDIRTKNVLHFDLADFEEFRLDEEFGGQHTSSNGASGQLAQKREEFEKARFNGHTPRFSSILGHEPPEPEELEAEPDPLLDIPGAPPRIKKTKLLAKVKFNLEDNLPSTSQKFKYYKKLNQHKNEESTESEYAAYLVASAKRGSRHDTLIRAAGKHLKANLHLLHGLAEEEVEAIVIHEVKQLNSLFETPLQGDELNGIAKDSVKYTIDDLLKNATRGIQAQEKMQVINEEIEDMRPVFEFAFPGTLIDTENPHKLVSYRFTDDYLAMATLHHYQNWLFKIQSPGKEDFYAFEPARFIWTKESHNFPLIRAFVREKREEAKNSKFFDIKCQKVDKDGVRTGQIDPVKTENETVKLLSESKMFAVTKYLISSNLMPTKKPEDLDANAELVATETDVVLCKSLTYRPKRADDYITTMCAVKYDPDEDCPFFKRWLREIFGENESTTEMVEAMQSILGYSFLGIDTGENVFCHIGDGSNGKSMLFKLISDIAGTYADRLNGEFLVYPTNKTTYYNRCSMERVLYRVEGKRLMIVDDLKGDKYTWNEEIIKALTDSKGSMRVEGGIAKTIPIRCKVHVAMNDFPKFETDTLANRRRIYLIPYKREFPPDAQVKLEIEGKFLKERAGIFNWIVEGANKWYEKGLPAVDEMSAYTREMLDEQLDWVEKDFYQLHFEKVPMPGTRDYINVKELYVHYRRVKDRYSQKEVDNVNTFGKKLGRYLGAERKKMKINGNAVVGWAVRPRLDSEEL